MLRLVDFLEIDFSQNLVRFLMNSGKRFSGFKHCLWLQHGRFHVGGQ
jgi:hypothetical protein